MKLSRISGALRGVGLLRDEVAPPEVRFTHLTDDSRQVREGSLFCAVHGTAADGHDFVDAAVSAGAAAVVVERAMDVSVPSLVVTNDRRATAVAAAEWFGRPGDRLDLIAVTGTNGKSTTVAMICHLLNADGEVGSLGTLGAFDGAGAALYREGLTTPGAVALQENLAELVKRGCRRVVMEASSHALDQERLFGLEIRGGVFTNVTHDHLDYHSTFEAYRRAKFKLAELIGAEGFQAVNGDDRSWADLPIADGQRRFRFGDVAGLRVTDARYSAEGSVGTLVLHGEEIPFCLPHLGAFNVYNALAALTAGLGLGVPIGELTARLRDAPQVPGRMERLSRNPLVIRDYAHTPDALERAIAATRPLTEARLLVLFGCGGDRDRSKRAPMARIGARDADLAILTSDNPRTENPEIILNEMAEGIDGQAFLQIVDRREAMARALALMGEGDCLLLAGKGHETYQVLGTERVPFDERAIVEELLHRRSSG